MSRGAPVAKPVVAAVRPAPEPAVLAAIVAAVQEAWPQPSPARPPGQQTPLWRFSGRWWARPTAMRRERPWMGGTR
ncbi:MAG: hypothetical protein ACYDA2_07270 [Acidimicrobiales bacterium]